ncbi:glycosyltransferase [Litoreibacter ponti]|uniref:glycosyltransferase n=1 Tax=Litoreibacter ponti TaxID=1510457 RepID=UPI001304D1AB|nr:glycosyltransferase [Litoreibacter ponti]
MNDDEILRQFDLLERITLPSLRDQSDPQFRLTLLCSARMPQEGREHLDWLLNHYLPGRSEAIFARPMIPGRVFRRQMQGLGRGDEPVIQTQICEGEGFGRNFVRRLREHGIESWAKLPCDGGAKAAKGTFMSFRRGLRLGMRGKAFVGLEPVTSPDMPFALSLVARPSSRYNPMLINADGLGHRFPHVGVMTQTLHCLRARNLGQTDKMLPPERRILSQAGAEFRVLRGGHRIECVEDQVLAKPVDVRLPKVMVG